MYTDEELDLAIKKGVFSSASVDAFRDLVAASKGSLSADEENVRLVGGFNDIFIVIACALLLFSALWVMQSVHDSLGYGVFAALAWGLSEVFVRRRKMALPAIVLLLAFVGGVFAFVGSIFGSQSSIAVILATSLSTVAAYVHWRRFNVPITVAVGTGAALAMLGAVMLSIFPQSEALLLTTFFVCGCLAFAFAMYWDAGDTRRTTRKSDVAFWLHLLSAPLIIHPIFSRLGVLEGYESLTNMAMIVVLYLLMTVVSLAIDRRAFMVSSLMYVIYALSSLLENYGGIGYGFAVTGVVMGASLLLLSAYWQAVRAWFVKKLPEFVRGYLPAIRE
ncbi:hypothetical protein HGG82_03860 [Marinomonas sp. M1K-6]|uniref:DUF2157 domain-containing protein n=1 Tax=Marinomonas profundi TaxID=2726122 RepID=A0A847R053_9GAMM|nr:hypothetical protein [Marinomonas profundi]NLQ16755.1 hypothetical protein [Marinomonas profundi]UDV02489.1 hypothetical protein J8N69_12955 [Marinomonas profundi]